MYIGLGFNTKLISPAEAPKTLEDLLDPKWKGKMSICATKPGITWIGNVLEAKGRDFLEKLSLQEVKVHNISGTALTALVASEEVPLSPTCFNGSFFRAQEKGAPIEWRPLEPVIANAGYAGMTIKAPNPHASLLFLGYLLSKEGQKFMMTQGQSSAREDVDASLMEKFALKKNVKKTIWLAKYSPEEFERRFIEWEELLKRLFIKKK